jgi:hypothetical protein
MIDEALAVLYSNFMERDLQALSKTQDVFFTSAHPFPQFTHRYFYDHM